MRAELLGVATINLFNFIYWALFLLYASRYLDVAPGTIGVVLGVAAAGTLVASALTLAGSRGRSGSGRRSSLGCFLFPAPLLLVPAAGGPHWLVIAFLFTAEFVSGLGLMLLDILAGRDPGRARSHRRSGRASRARSWSSTTACGRLARRSPASSARRSASTRRSGSARAARCSGWLFLLPSPIRQMHEVPEPAEIEQPWGAVTERVAEPAPAPER